MQYLNTVISQARHAFERVHPRPAAEPPRGFGQASAVSRTGARCGASVAAGSTRASASPMDEAMAAFRQQMAVTFRPRDASPGSPASRPRALTSQADAVLLLYNAVIDGTRGTSAEVGRIDPVVQPGALVDRLVQERRVPDRAIALLRGAVADVEAAVRLRVSAVKKGFPSADVVSTLAQLPFAVRSGDAGRIEELLQVAAADLHKAASMLRPMNVERRFEAAVGFIQEACSIPLISVDQGRRLLDDLKTRLRRDRNDPGFDPAYTLHEARPSVLLTPLSDDRSRAAETAFTVSAGRPRGVRPPTAVSLFDAICQTSRAYEQGGLNPDAITGLRAWADAVPDMVANLLRGKTIDASTAKDLRRGAAQRVETALRLLSAEPARWPQRVGFVRKLLEQTDLVSKSAVRLTGDDRHHVATLASSLFRDIHGREAETPVQTAETAQMGLDTLAAVRDAGLVSSAQFSIMTARFEQEVGWRVMAELRGASKTSSASARAPGATGLVVGAVGGSPKIEAKPRVFSGARDRR